MDDVAMVQVDSDMLDAADKAAQAMWAAYAATQCGDHRMMARLRAAEDMDRLRQALDEAFDSRAEPAWVIVNVEERDEDGGLLFWCNSQGWTAGVVCGDWWPLAKVGVVNLPMGGAWMELRQAQVLGGDR